jgi:hypothetical protein
MIEQMCFSATASFALSGALVPAGLFCLYRARKLGPGWLAFATFPLAFALQQALEGMVWLGLDTGSAQLAAIGTTGFLFFSHFFWLIWVPVSVYLLHREDDDGPPGLAAFIVAGAVLGIVLYAPVLSLAGSVPVSTASGHISYQVPLLMADSELARFALKLIYFVIIVGSLGVSSDRRIQGFGGLIALSLIATELWFADAFVSVWCFFAAVLSLYISVILLRAQPAAARS